MSTETVSKSKNQKPPKDPVGLRVSLLRDLRTATDTFKKGEILLVYHRGWRGTYVLVDPACVVHDVDGIPVRVSGGSSLLLDSDRGEYGIRMIRRVPKYDIVFRGDDRKKETP